MSIAEVLSRNVGIRDCGEIGKLVCTYEKQGGIKIHRRAEVMWRWNHKLLGLPIELTGAAHLIFVFLLNLPGKFVASVWPQKTRIGNMVNLIKQAPGSAPEPNSL